MSLPIGIQLFSVRDAMDADVEGTLRQIAAMGYDGIEPCGGAYGMDPKEFRALCDSLGLQIISAHVSYGALRDDTEATLDLYETLGTKYLTYPLIAPDDLPGTDAFADTLSAMVRIGKAAQARGMQPLYHNHSFEFEKVNGTYKLDALFGCTTPETLGVELDTCWARFADVDPAKYIRQYSGRIPCVHAKDLAMEAPGKRDTMEIRPVGYGILDMPGILAACRDAGTQWIIVEQDNPAPSMKLDALESIKASIDYLRSFDW